VRAFQHAQACAFVCQPAASLRSAASQHFSKSSHHLAKSIDLGCRW
jgi:hypothetical protein